MSRNRVSRHNKKKRYLVDKRKASNKEAYLNQCVKNKHKLMLNKSTMERRHNKTFYNNDNIINGIIMIDGKITQHYSMMLKSTNIRNVIFGAPLWIVAGTGEKQDELIELYYGLMEEIILERVKAEVSRDDKKGYC